MPATREHPRRTEMGAASETVVADREAAVREILSGFGLSPGAATPGAATPGAATSGVAFGGRFVPSPGGPEVETMDPTTGTVLARVRTAAEADRAAAAGAASEA